MYSSEMGLLTTLNKENRNMTDKEILLNNLLNVLGLQIKDNKIYDQDNFTFLVYNGGYLYPANTIGMINHKKDIEFDPIANAKLAKYLFNMLLTKETEDNDLYVNSFGSAPSVTAVPPKYRLEVSTKGGHFNSEYYYMESLQYIEMMFQITGSPIPVSIAQFDKAPLTQNEIEELKTANKRKR